MLACETETTCFEIKTETETIKIWSRDINIPGFCVFYVYISIFMFGRLIKDYYYYYYYFYYVLSYSDVNKDQTPKGQGQGLVNTNSDNGLFDTMPPMHITICSRFQ